jgi:hypothetical protein
MNKYNYNLNTFYNEDANSYYLLGAFMTDGCIYTRKNRPNSKIATLTSKDEDWLKIINSKICPEKPLLNHGLNCFRLMYMSSELCNWFESKGCYQQKSLTLTMPKVPVEYLYDFIRGCWDGDGSLSFTKSANKGTSYQAQANLTSGSLKFCEQLASLLNQENIKCSVKEHNFANKKIEGREITSNNCWRVVLSGGGSVYNLVKNLYTTNQISMPRKYNLAQNIIDWRESNFKITDTV